MVYMWSKWLVLADAVLMIPLMKNVIFSIGNYNIDASYHKSTYLFSRWGVLALLLQIFNVFIVGGPVFSIFHLGQRFKFTEVSEAVGFGWQNLREGFGNAMVTDFPLSFTGEAGLILSHERSKGITGVMIWFFSFVGASALLPRFCPSGFLRISYAFM